MPKVEVIATRTAKFAKPGTRKSLTHAEAKALVAVKQAEYADVGDGVARRRSYERRDMVATPAASGPEPQRARVPRRAGSLVPTNTNMTSESDGEA